METFAVGLEKVALYMFGLGIIALTVFFVVVYLLACAKSCSEYFKTVNNFSKKLLKLTQSFKQHYFSHCYRFV